MWIVPYFYSPLAFIGTFIYLRFFGAAIRRFVSPDKANQWSSLRANVFFCAPAVGLGTLLLFLRSEWGWVIVSPSAIWLSFAWDGFCLVATLAYANRLRSLRTTPFAPASVKLSPLEEFSRWPHARSFHFKILGSWILRRMFRQAGFDTALGRLLQNNLENNLVISPGDLQNALGNDLRYIDIVSDMSDELEIDPDKAEEIPHLLVIRAEIFQQAAITFLRKFARDDSRIPELPDEEEGSAARDRSESYSYDLAKFFQSVAGVTSRSYPFNRALNTALPAELWESSCNTCQNTPQVIATTWKLFHFQDEARLRLVTLFNVIDLTQRLIGSYALSMLRDSGELVEMWEASNPRRSLPPGNFAQWNSTLVWALRNSSEPQLQLLREMLLEPRDDFQELLNALGPFWRIIGYSPAYDPAEAHTLAAWEILGVIRNKTIGHGIVGLSLKLHPRDYIGPLHRYFLTVMREVSALDLAVYGFESKTTAELAAFSQGLRSASTVDECDAWMQISAETLPVNISPYLRFLGGRVLFPNRKTQRGFQYVDYKPQTIAEPSFITMSVDPGLFVNSRMEEFRSITDSDLPM